MNQPMRSSSSRGARLGRSAPARALSSFQPARQQRRACLNVLAAASVPPGSVSVVLLSGGVGKRMGARCVSAESTPHASPVTHDTLQHPEAISQAPWSGDRNLCIGHVCAHGGSLRGRRVRQVAALQRITCLTYSSTRRRSSSSATQSGETCSNDGWRRLQSTSHSSGRSLAQSDRWVGVQISINLLLKPHALDRVPRMTSFRIRCSTGCSRFNKRPNWWPCTTLRVPLSPQRTLSSALRTRLRWDQSSSRSSSRQITQTSDQRSRSVVLLAPCQVGAAVLGVPVKPTIKEVDGPSLNVVKTLNRAKLWEVQTPQVGRARRVRSAGRRSKRGMESREQRGFKRDPPQRGMMCEMCAGHQAGAAQEGL